MKTNNHLLFDFINSDDFWYYRKFDGRKKHFRGVKKVDFMAAQNKAVARRFAAGWGNPEPSLLRKNFMAVREWSKPSHGNYRKIVVDGFTHLYLCSPIYGHRDYNKSRLLPLSNVRGCDLLRRVCDYSGL